jgi:hypothetical protein
MATAWPISPVLEGSGVWNSSKDVKSHEKASLSALGDVLLFLSLSHRLRGRKDASLDWFANLDVGMWKQFKKVFSKASTTKIQRGEMGQAILFLVDRASPMG